MDTRRIPKNGETLPVIGLGTWRRFDVAPWSLRRHRLVGVLKDFVSGGGRLIDTSPMYGRAEPIIGKLLSQLGLRRRVFLATKVWTEGGRNGIAQLERSMCRLQSDRLDLVEIHNLVDWRTHLPMLREWKKAGRIRHLGITHYASDAFQEMETIMRSHDLDFIQLPYSIARRSAEDRLLPVARDTGTAVLVMRPFEEGKLFRLVHGRRLPEWAAELDCDTWSQFFLKFILGHPAVTASVPATSDGDHIIQNLSAGAGILPDESTRRRMVEYLAL